MPDRACLSRYTITPREFSRTSPRLKYLMARLHASMGSVRPIFRTLRVAEFTLAPPRIGAPYGVRALRGCDNIEHTTRADDCARCASSACIPRNTTYRPEFVLGAG